MMWADLRFRLRALFRRVAMDGELNDELRFHLVRSLLNVRALRLGYDADALVVIDGNMRGTELNLAQRNELVERMRAAVQSVPGVHSSTLHASTPFAGSEGRGAPYVPGRDSLNLLGRYTLQTGSPGYFATMGTRILRGRGFEPTDVRGAPPIVIISKGMADAIWPHEDPLGKRLRIGPDSLPMLTVVGVAEDVVNRQIGGPSDFWYYLPFEQYQSMFGSSIRPNLLVRVQGEPAAYVEPLRSRLQREMPGDAYVRVAPFRNVLEPQTRSWRTGATMFVIFASLALVLATIGLYSVVAYTVAQRTRELGVRIALGASVGNVVRTVVRQGVAFAVVGIAAGGAVALYASRYIEPLLFETSPRDPFIYGSVAAILLLVAIAATLRPALRACRVDPTVALRGE
jgi:predicted permease